MEINLSKIHEVTNDSFFGLYGNQDRYLVLYGGADSGKSRFAAQKLVARSIVDAQAGIKHRWLIIRKTRPAIRKSAYELMRTTLKQFGLSDQSDITITPMRMTLPDLCGTEFLFEGLDDPEKLKSIEGITGVWCEEATEITFEDFMQIDLRLRGKTPSYKQIILSFNPVSAESWIKKQSGFFDRLPTSKIKVVTPHDWPSSMTRLAISKGAGAVTHATLHHSTVTDNQFVDPQDIEILDNLAEKDPNFYKVYRLGEWGLLKGLIFKGWILEKESSWPKLFQQRCFGLDFGFSNNPSALVEIGFTDEVNLWVREWVYEKALTNPALASRAQEALQQSGMTEIIADSAEPKSIVEIKQEGLPIIQSTKGPDSVRNGIQRMQQYIVHIHPESCNVWKEYQNYKWAEDKDGNPLNKPVDFMNHAMDAIRYGVQHLRGKSHAGIVVSSFVDVEKQDRKDMISDPGYDPLQDGVLWNEFVNDDDEDE